jgi:hypothetical protein
MVLRPFRDGTRGRFHSTTMCPGPVVDDFVQLCPGPVVDHRFIHSFMHKLSLIHSSMHKPSLIISAISIPRLLLDRLCGQFCRIIL